MSSISDNSNDDNVIKQWISEVVDFSSQYDTVHWGADQIIGEPKVYPQYGDIYGAWAQRSRDNSQFIVVKFAQPAYLTELNIYETYHCGAIVKIKVKNNESEEWVTVWQSPNNQPECLQESRIFKPTLEKTSFKTQLLRLELDCTAAHSWCEIDAVEMVGKHFFMEPVPTEKTLSSNMLSLLASEEFSDIKFEVEGKIINGHRNIFAARSIYFKNIICETVNLDPKNIKPVHMENISYETFKALMYYLYSGNLEASCSGETVCDLIRASKWYDLENFDEVGYTFVKKNLCHENVISILVNATKKEPHLNRIEKLCLKYFAKNFNSVLTNPEFKNLDKSILVKITQYYGQFFQKQI